MCKRVVRTLIVSCPPPPTPPQAEFAVLRDYAQAQGVLTWRGERARTMVVTRASHDDVKRFWKRYSKSN